MFALIKFEAHFVNAEIIAVGSESEMLTAHAATVDGNRVFHSVRPVDHEMTITAAKAMAKRLPFKQGEALRGLYAAGAGEYTIKPGSRKLRTRVDVPGFEESTDLIAPARRLEAKGFVQIGGQAYAPKTFRLTPIGRVVGSTL
jgi:hypothetical protein